MFKDIALGCYSNQDCWGRFKNYIKYSLILKMMEIIIII